MWTVYVVRCADDSLYCGITNDLPADSSYRTVTPMAATIRLEGGTAQVTPWLIDYKRFNDPKRNRFFASPPEIEHKVG